MVWLIGYLKITEFFCSQLFRKSKSTVFPKLPEISLFPLPYPAPIFPLSDSANHDPKAGPVPDAKIFKDAELINMIDPILEADDRNKALYIIIHYRQILANLIKNSVEIYDYIFKTLFSALLFKPVW